MSEETEQPEPVQAGPKKVTNPQPQRTPKEQAVWNCHRFMGMPKVSAEHFLRNAGDSEITAMAAAEALLGRKLDEDAVRDATAAVTMPGRMEPVSKRPLVIVDGAHNADGVATLVSSLREEFPSTSWQVVLGVMGDKNIELMIEQLGPIASGFVATAPASERALKPEELAGRINGHFDLPVLVEADVEHALDMARAEATTDGAVLVTGSLYLVGEVRDLLQHVDHLDEYHRGDRQDR